MLQLGYDPQPALDEALRLSFLSRLENKDYSFGAISPESKHLIMALEIAAALLAASFPTLRGRIWEVSKAKYPQALIVAERIVALIDGAGARTPQDCRKVLVDAIQLLGIPKETYEISCEVWPNKAKTRPGPLNRGNDNEHGL
ncbi:MAG: hypothetical protein ACYSTI_13140 [Planctomycetota bacterium]|jgi:hypothetical protein